MTTWFLEGYLPGNNARQHLLLNTFPVLIGRQAGLTLADASANLSRYHAELILRGGRLMLRDLGSRNGTFVNRQRIEGEREIAAGDVLHFADAEFRLGRLATDHDTEADHPTGRFARSLPRHFPPAPDSLAGLFEPGGINPLFQPIVTLQDEQTVAYECLVRGDAEGLPESPDELLRLAEADEWGVTLSEHMRECTAAAAQAGGLTEPLFVNIHPREMVDLSRLLRHLGRIVDTYPALTFVLELHEAAIPDLAAVAELARGLTALGVGLAYDDFGAGQARLMELVETPPDYLKFDRSLLEGIDQRPASQRNMLSMLVGYARQHGIRTLAEGLSTAAEARVCRELGFELAQGYLYGRPAPVPASRTGSPG